MNIESIKHTPYLDPEPCNFDPQILPDLIVQQQLDKEKGINQPYQLIPGGQEDWKKVIHLYSVELKQVIQQAHHSGRDGLITLCSPSHLSLVPRWVNLTLILSWLAFCFAHNLRGLQCHPNKKICTIFYSL